MPRSTYVWCPVQEKVVPKGQERRPKEAKRAFNVMPDIEPFQSPIDWKWVTSRTERREHNKRHNVIDVGNDPAVLRSKAPYKPEGVHRDVAQAIEQLRSR